MKCRWRRRAISSKKTSKPHSDEFGLRVEMLGMIKPRRGWGAAAMLLAATAAPAGVCFAGTSEDSTAGSATTRPLLEELNRETQSLYKDSAPAIVRLELPLPQEAEILDDPLAKWAGQLDPVVRQRLEELQQRNEGQTLVREEITPATAPAEDGSQPPAPGAPNLIVMQLRPLRINSVGVVIDDQQHVLVPRFVDKNQFAGAIPALLSDGRIVSATLVGSDRLTELSVLKLQGTSITPAAFSNGQIDLGTLLMVMSLNPAATRLAVWQGSEPDDAALIGLDGRVAGFARAGHFLPGSQCGSVIEQLIEYGQVRRPQLGVIVRPVPMNDPQRQDDPSLGETPALRVQSVLADSAAQKAGLQPGDLILKLAGQPVGDFCAFAAAIAQRQGNTDLLILRDGKQISASVDLQTP
jgi:S1-C subfamily serine protease